MIPDSEKLPFYEQTPQLNNPDFMDFQDFVNPIMRLDLQIVPEPLSDSVDSPAPGPQPEILEFSRREQSILDEFDLMFDNMVTSCNENFIRPEFCKIKVVCKEQYADDLEEELRVRRLNFTKKAATHSAAAGGDTGRGASFNAGAAGGASASRLDATTISSSKLNFPQYDALLY